MPYQNVRKVTRQSKSYCKIGLFSQTSSMGEVNIYSLVSESFPHLTSPKGVLDRCLGYIGRDRTPWTCNNPCFPVWLGIRWPKCGVGWRSYSCAKPRSWHRIRESPANVVDDISERVYSSYKQLTWLCWGRKERTFSFNLTTFRVWS